MICDSSVQCFIEIFDKEILLKNTNICCIYLLPFYHLFNNCFIFPQKLFSNALSYITSSKAPKGTNRLLAKITVLVDPNMSSLALSNGISANVASPALKKAQENCDFNELGFL